MIALAGQRVLVTGGSGFIGRHVVEQGLRAGAEVHTLAKEPSSISGITHHAGDIGDAGFVDAMVKDVSPNAVLHLAAAGVAGASGDVERVNAGGTANLLEALRRRGGVSAVVAAGSGYEYIPAEHPLSESDPCAGLGEYGRSKVAAFRIAESYSLDLPITWLRLFNVYGPGEAQYRLLPGMFRDAIEYRPIELSDCEQVRDFTYVTDVAAAFWRAAAKPAPQGAVRVLNIASGIAVRLRQIVEAAATALRREGYDCELRYGARARKPEEPPYYVADASRARRELGWQAKTGLEAGIGNCLSGYLEKHRHESISHRR